MGKNIVAVATLDVTSVKVAVIVHSSTTSTHTGMFENTENASLMSLESPDTFRSIQETSNFHYELRYNISD